MTLPAVAALTQERTQEERSGIGVGLFGVDVTSDLEIERAPDSGGSPDTGSAETIAIVPPGTGVWVDELPRDGARRHYRIRSVGQLGTASAWTGWVSAIPGPLPAKVIRPAPAPLVVKRTKVLSGTTGTLTLAIVDPQSRLTLVEFRTKVGAGSYSSWSTDGTAPYETTVTITPGQRSLIGYRVTGYDADGVLRVLREGEEEFDGSHLIGILTLSASFDEDGALRVRAIGDFNTGSIRVAVSTSAFPSSGTVGAATAVDGRQSEWTFAGPYALGQAVYISAIAYTGAAGAGTATDKMDTLVYRANSATSKTIRLPAAAVFTPYLNSGVFSVANGYYSWTNDLQGNTGFLPLPKGATLTAVRGRAWAKNSGGFTGDFVSFGVRRVGQDGALTTLGTNAENAAEDTWETLAVTSLAEDTSGDRSHQLVATGVGGTGGSGFEFRLAWIEYDIDVPSVDVST